MHGGSEGAQVAAGAALHTYIRVGMITWGWVDASPPPTLPMCNMGWPRAFQQGTCELASVLWVGIWVLPAGMAGQHPPAVLLAPEVPSGC